MMYPSVDSAIAFGSTGAFGSAGAFGSFGAFGAFGSAGAATPISGKSPGTAGAGFLSTGMTS